MKLDLSEIMQSLEGETLKHGDKDLTIGIAISTILVNTNKSGDPLRDYLLGKKLIGTEGEVDLDVAEVEALKTAIKGNETYFVLVKGQLLSKFV